MKNRLINLGVGFLVVTHSLAFLGGCTDKTPARVAWLSAEKPPIKIIYIDKQGELDPNITDKLLCIVAETPYRKVKINNSTSVSVTANSHQTDVESDTDSLTINRSK